MVSSIDIEPENVSAHMEMTVKVTNKKFTKELLNRSSSEFQKFNETFTKQMDIIYSGISEYETVNITKLTPGSVVVEHDVILKANFTPDYKKLIDKIAKKVEEKIMNATQEQILKNDTCTSLLCFNMTATKVQNVSVAYDPKEECRKKAGEDFAEYFLVEYKNEKANCINRCTVVPVA